jgi:hypothetical protein
MSNWTWALSYNDLPSARERRAFLGLLVLCATLPWPGSMLALRNVGESMLRYDAHTYWTGPMVSTLTFLTERFEGRR